MNRVRPGEGESSTCPQHLVSPCVTVHPLGLRPVPRMKELGPRGHMGLTDSPNTGQEVVSARFLGRTLVLCLLLRLGVLYTSFSFILHSSPAKGPHLRAEETEATQLCLSPNFTAPATSYKRGIKSKEKLTLLWSRQDRPEGQLHEEECELHFVGETQIHRSQKSGESSINRLESEQEVIPGRKRQVKRVESGCR